MNPLHTLHVLYRYWRRHALRTERRVAKRELDAVPKKPYRTRIEIPAQPYSAFLNQSTRNSMERFKRESGTN